MQADRAAPGRLRAGDHDFARLAAAEVEDHAGRGLDAGHRRGRVDATLEAVAGVGLEPQLAAGRGRADRIEQRRLDEDIDRVGGTAGALAADHPTQAEDAGGVRDRRHLAVELVDLAVQRVQRFPRLARADEDVARDLVGVEDVQGARDVEGEEVGDVDQGGDRAQADRQQALLQPVRAGAVLHAADIAAGIEGAGGRIGQREADPDRAGECGRHRRHVAGLQPAHAGRGQVAGQAADAQAVGPVGRDLHVEDWVVEPHDGREGLAHGGVGGQVDDALVVVRQAHLVGRAQHAVGGLAADLAGLEEEPGARDDRARAREDALHAGAGVGRAAHDLDLVAAGIDDADAQAVGIGVLHGGNDMADGEGRQPRRRVVDAVDLVPQHGQAGRDGGEIGIRVQVVAEPGKRDLHRDSPPDSVGTSSGTKP